MKIPLGVTLDIHEFSGSGITSYESGLTNAVLHKKGDAYKVTQRPSIDISEDSSDASLTHLNDRGRGIYYWEAVLKLIIAHDNDLYKDNQQTGNNIGSISAGSERVTILETIGGTPYLVVLDAENDEGWVVNTSYTVAAIASNFPSTLCHGGSVLDTYLFVMDEDGIIYNSNTNDPTIFGATSFVSTERENDKGVYLGKHHDHLVAFNTRSIEFFYDAGNTSGSPLNRRQDISYNIGCADGLGVWENGDKIYFIGSNPSGQLSIYVLENFQIKQISNDSLDSYLTQGLTQSGLRVVLNGLSAMGNDTLLLTVYTLSGTSETGTHTGANNATVLTDSSKTWTTNEHVGATITNSTDGSSGTITSNTANTATLSGGLSGGTDDDFDTNDAYTITSAGYIVPKRTLSYDTKTKPWGFWKTALNSLTTFPLMAWTRRTGGQNATLSARTGEGILYNGDIININDKLVPVDSLLGSGGVYEAGVYETDVYVSTSVGSGSNIDLTIRTGLQDGGISSYKFQNKETVVMESTPSSQTLTVKHSDEDANNFDSGNTIDTSDDRKDIFQGGRFIKRNYQLEYSGDEQVFLEAIDIDAVGGM